MKKKIGIGISDFRELRTGDFLFIDKSMLIADIINAGAKVLLLPRPRGFGKTLNLSMLRCFFERHDDREAKENSALFNGLAIRETEEFKKHLGRYPVIFLTFKDVKEMNFDDAIRQLQLIISTEVRTQLGRLDNKMPDVKDLWVLKKICDNELKELFVEYGMEDRLEEADQWYNGYRFGDNTIFNPWSILNFMEEAPAFPKPYWANTSSNALIRELIVDGGLETRENIKRLINGKSIDSVIDENMEMKSVTGFYKEEPEKAVKEAINQIGTREYAKDLEARGFKNILKIVVVSDGKKVWVKKV